MTIYNKNSNKLVKQATLLSKQVHRISNNEQNNANLDNIKVSAFKKIKIVATAFAAIKCAR